MQLRITILFLLSFPLAKAQTVALAADSLSGLPGSQVSVPVLVSGFAGIATFQGTLEWDTAVVDYAGVSNFGLAGMNAGSFGTTLTGDGKLTFSWDDAMLQGVTLADSSVLFNVEFDLDGGMGTGTSLDFTSNPTALEFSDENFSIVPHQTTPGYIFITDTTTTTFSNLLVASTSMDIFPNPLAPHSVVEFDGGMNGEVELELWDGMGKRLRKINVQTVSGRNRFALYNGFANGISSGIYWIICLGEEAISRHKLIVE